MKRLVSQAEQDQSELVLSRVLYVLSACIQEPATNTDWNDNGNSQKAVNESLATVIHRVVSLYPDNETLVSKAAYIARKLTAHYPEMASCFDASLLKAAD
jgi:hypothetical protein